MMAMQKKAKNLKPIQIVGGTNPGRYSDISRESTYNMIVTDGALVPYSGYEQVLQLSILGQARGLYSSTLFDHMIAVVNNEVKIISSSLGIATIGTLSTSSGDVYFAENANSQIAISDGENYYVYNYALETFALVDIGFSPGYLTAQGGYIFAVVNNSSQVRYSNVNDALTWDVRNANSLGNDIAIGVIALGQLVYIIGSKFSRISRNLGTAVNPFKIDSSVNILYGTVNRNSIASGFDMLVWFGYNESSNGTILMSTGGTPRIISTPGIDYIISQLTNPNDCSAFIFQEDGHIFYQITWTKDNLTLVYDFTSNSFLYATDESLNQHIAKDVVHFDGSYYFISFTDSYLYQLSSTITTYSGNIIPRIRICPPIREPDFSYWRTRQVQVIAEQGQSATPMHIDMSISRDGGVTFGNAIRKDLGALANRRALTRWWQLGWGNNWTFQFRFYGLDRFVILGSYLEAY